STKRLDSPATSVIGPRSTPYRLEYASTPLSVNRPSPLYPVWRKQPAISTAATRRRSAGSRIMLDGSGDADQWLVGESVAAVPAIKDCFQWPPGFPDRRRT